MKIILASQSPRRKFILGKLGIEFAVIPSDFEEYFDELRSPKEIAEELGLGKALDVATKYPDSIVIGSDLVIAFEGRQLGKPENKEEAREMLKSYSNKSQKIITSVAVVCINKGFQEVSSDSATIRFGEINDDFIEMYLKKYDVFDRAGGYDIRHEMIKELETEIVGRIDTVVGLPSNVLSRILRKLNVETTQLPDEGRELFDEKEFTE